jgi:hypothetical protein
MTGKDRREKIIDMIRNSSEPIPGNVLSRELSVSRQVIVQDVALIREGGTDIISTNRGYIIEQSEKAHRVFKVQHSDCDSVNELNLIVDCGGTVRDVFVYHHVYGVISANMNLKSRVDVENYMNEISSGRSSYLKKITSDYHYHTVEADSENTLDLIQDKLKDRGFLAKLQDYEPVNFSERAIHTQQPQ